MKDETYVFISDVKDKKVTARSARHQRTHTGKGGRVRLPSDNLSKKELMKMNGECKSYRLNSPMTWHEFMSMPDDIKITYIKLLREKFDVPDCEIYRMFGTDKDRLSQLFKKLGLRVPRRNVHRKWQKDEWFAWVHGVDTLPTPVPEEEPMEVPVIEEAPVHFYTEEERATIFGETNGYVEDDLPVEEPDVCGEAEEVVESMRPSRPEMEKAEAEREWLRNECDSLRMKVRILEAQMDVVRLIFGGRNNG